MPLPCLLSYCRVRTPCLLTRLHLTATVDNLSDLFLLRKFLPSLETLEGKFTVVGAQHQGQQHMDPNIMAHLEYAVSHFSVLHLQ